MYLSYFFQPFLIGFSLILMDFSLFYRISHPLSLYFFSDFAWFNVLLFFGFFVSQPIALLPAPCQFSANALLTFCQYPVNFLSTPYQLPVFYSLFLCRSPVVSMFLINHCYVFLLPSVLFHSSEQLFSLEWLSLCTRVNKPVHFSATIEMLIENRADALYLLLYSYLLFLWYIIDY